MPSPKSPHTPSSKPLPALGSTWWHPDGRTLTVVAIPGHEGGDFEACMQDGNVEDWMGHPENLGYIRNMPTSSAPIREELAASTKQLEQIRDEAAGNQLAPKSYLGRSWSDPVGIVWVAIGYDSTYSRGTWKTVFIMSRTCKKTHRRMLATVDQYDLGRSWVPMADVSIGGVPAPLPAPPKPQPASATQQAFLEAAEASKLGSNMLAAAGICGLSADDLRKMALAMDSGLVLPTGAVVKG